MTLLRIVLFLSSAAAALAQGNYEIQAYPSETQDPGTTMIELHSNFTVEGSKGIMDGIYGTEHQLHETVEITQGWTKWFETGFYIFTSYPNQGGLQWVGDHIRPRAGVPESWHWPVGVSLPTSWATSAMFFPPTRGLGRSVRLSTSNGELVSVVQSDARPEFSRAEREPRFGLLTEFQGWLDFTKKINAGLEYYGSLGPIGNFDPLFLQEQQIVPAIDLNLSPKWEFNFGVGVGVTRGTDHLLMKMILGRRFGGGSKSSN